METDGPMRGTTARLPGPLRLPRRFSIPPTAAGCIWRSPCDLCQTGLMQADEHARVAAFGTCQGLQLTSGLPRLADVVNIEPGLPPVNGRAISALTERTAPLLWVVPAPKG